MNDGYGETLTVIVGLPDAAVRESRDASALGNSGFKMPFARGHPQGRSKLRPVHRRRHARGVRRTRRNRRSPVNRRAPDRHPGARSRHDRQVARRCLGAFEGREEIEKIDIAKLFAVQDITGRTSPTSRDRNPLLKPASRLDHSIANIPLEVEVNDGLFLDGETLTVIVAPAGRRGVIAAMRTEKCPANPAVHRDPQGQPNHRRPRGRRRNHQRTNIRDPPRGCRRARSSTA